MKQLNFKAQYLSFIILLVSLLLWTGCSGDGGGGDNTAQNGGGGGDNTSQNPTQYTLTVYTVGAMGTITSSPAGINCGTDCTEAYNAGTVVSLTATPIPGGSSFTGWSGDSDCSDGTVTMNTSKTCAATFQCLSNIGCVSDREICNKAECSSALNRVYKVIIKDASLNYTPNSVDGDFSYPDPYVQVYFPNINTLVGTTSTVTDTLKPFWNQYAEATVTADGQSIWFCMYDSDQPFSADDPLYFVSSSLTGNCMEFDNILPFIKAGEASISGNADVNYLNVSIEPK